MTDAGAGDAKQSKPTVAEAGDAKQAEAASLARVEAAFKALKTNDDSQITEALAVLSCRWTDPMRALALESRGAKSVRSFGKVPIAFWRAGLDALLALCSPESQRVKLFVPALEVLTGMCRGVPGPSDEFVSQLLSFVQASSAQLVFVLQVARVLTPIAVVLYHKDPGTLVSGLTALAEVPNRSSCSLTSLNFAMQIAEGGADTAKRSAAVVQSGTCRRAVELTMCAFALIVLSCDLTAAGLLAGTGM
jgi:hypothetical protein